jgi:tRNA U34 5-carboxymethylaminomethyl modifying GTPase MnmE/TrmE
LLAGSLDRDTDVLESVDDADWLRHRATEMDITMIGLQNAGKTSLLRVLAVSSIPNCMSILRIS